MTEFVLGNIAVESPLGLMTLAFEGDELVSATWTHSHANGNRPRYLTSGLTRRQQVVVNHITQYFEGRNSMVTVDMRALKGTPFQKKVWSALLRIPRGETRSYAEIARVVQSPKALRAVGQACGRNPLPLFIPCHRVVGASGKLTGFSAGLWRKEWLLNFESETKTFQREAMMPTKMTPTTMRRIA